MSNPPFADIAAANIGPKERMCVNGGAPGLSSGPCASGKTFRFYTRISEAATSTCTLLCRSGLGITLPHQPNDTYGPDQQHGVLLICQH